MKWIVGIWMGVACGMAAAEPVTVFQSKTDGYSCYRIPAIVAAKDGILLAFCEARKNDCKDHGDIDLVMKRSSDGGVNWEPMTILHDGGGDTPVTMGNPAPVVDASGVVHLVFCRDNSSVLYTSSADTGLTWKPAVEITAGLRQENWGWYATGPCHGIQISNGKQKGRLVIPSNHRIGARGDDKGTYGSHVIFSDDSGRTWQLGAIAGEADGIHPNETTAVELEAGADGNSRILFNTRNNKGTNPLSRAAAISEDGGKTFASAYRGIADLDTPACQGSILRWDWKTMFFTSPRGKSRENHTLWKSTDEGATWSVDRVIRTGPSAYGDLVKIGDGKLGVLFENGAENRYERISFDRLEVK